MQPLARKTPAVPRAGFAAGDVPRSGAEGGAAQPRYVHTPSICWRGDRKVIEFRGDTHQGEAVIKAERKAKITRKIVDSLNWLGRSKEAKALATCGDFFDIWHRKRPGRVVGDLKLLPCPCNSVFCPDCANRRSRPLQKKLLRLVNKPGRSYWFLTLTVPSQQNMTRQDITEITEKFGKLWKSWVFRRVEVASGKAFKISGGVRSVECTYNERSGWHPHIHVLLECPKTLPSWWLVLVKAEWEKITGDAKYVHLTPAYGQTKRGRKMRGRLNYRALRELCKYVTKCAEFAAEPLLVGEFLDAFKDAKRIQCFGSFLTADGSEREPGEDELVIAEQTLAADGYQKLPLRAHADDIETLPDGTKQLKFAFLERVTAVLDNMEESPPWELTAQEFAPDDQRRIGFSGALPEKRETDTLTLFGESAA